MMRLHGKSAVIYGANSPAGASVARAFAGEGATVFLAGRSVSRLEPVADGIRAAGGTAFVAQVDPLDPESVAEHLHAVVIQHGTVDVSVNLAFLGMEGTVRLCNLTDEQFAAATFTRIRSNFVTMAAAAREMAYQGKGIILATGVPGPAAPEGKRAGPAVGSAAIEALCQQFTSDVGSFGVRLGYLSEIPASEADLVEHLFGVLVAVPASFAEMSQELPNAPGAPRAEEPAGIVTG